MTSRNSSWRFDADMLRAPIRLLPAGKDYLWGGMRLQERFGKKSELLPLAETWECSTHPDGLSYLADVPDRSLHDLLQEHPELMGTHPARSMPEAVKRGELPILVKFIDAASDLSVQVHPDDDYARRQEGGQLGKSEMWYVVEALPGSQLVHGFACDMSPEAVRESIQNGTLERKLLHIPVEKDDVFYIPSGTVHAIGAGCLILEVQESSNLTYRLYDYHRKDKTGKERPLHLEKALEVADLKGSDSPRQPMRVLRYRPGCASEFLCRCRYFEVKRILLHTVSDVLFRTDASSFHVLICTDGAGVLSCKSICLPFSKGDTFFVPAESERIHMQGAATLVDVNC